MQSWIFHALDTITVTPYSYFELCPKSQTKQRKSAFRNVGSWNLLLCLHYIKMSDSLNQLKIPKLNEFGMVLMTDS